MSTISADVSVLVRKGARVDLWIQEPVDWATRCRRDPSEHVDTRSMLRLLELDEVMPAAAAKLAKTVESQICRLS